MTTSSQHPARQQISTTSADSTPKFCCQSIEPELGQPLIGAHEILL
jgi:hypothetical protein